MFPLPELFLALKKERYSLSTLKADIIAGSSLAVITFPVAMALSVAAGLPPAKGIFTAVVAGIFSSFFCGSKFQVSGPTAAFVVVTYAVTVQHGYDGLVIAMIMAGIILIISGYARVGQLVKFIPRPVVVAFSSGIAIMLASSQINDFLGLQIDKVPANLVMQWQAYIPMLSNINLQAIAVGIITLSIIIVSRLYSPNLPSYIFALAAGTTVSLIFSLDIDTVGSKFGSLPTSIPPPELPKWNFRKIIDVIPSGFTIAFIAGIESLLSALVADGMTGDRHNSNKEIMAQGIANIASAVFGGIPASAGIGRTMTNVRMGGKTPMSAIFHSVLLLMVLQFAADIVTFIPTSCVAAILFIVSWDMKDFGNYIHIFRISPSDRLILILTFVLTIFVGVGVAIGVGVTLASLLFMKHMSGSVEIRNYAPRGSQNKDKSMQRKNLPEGVEVFQINGPVFFGVASELLEKLRTLGQMPRILILRMRFVPYLDSSGEAILRDMIKQQCRKSNTTVIFSALQKQPAEVLGRAGIKPGTEGISFQPDYEAALVAADILLSKE